MDILLTEEEIKAEVESMFGSPNEVEMEVLEGLCCAQARKAWKVIFPQLDLASNIFCGIAKDCAGESQFMCKEGDDALSRIWWAFRHAWRNDMIDCDNGRRVNQCATSIH